LNIKQFKVNTCYRYVWPML